MIDSLVEEACESRYRVQKGRVMRDIIENGAFKVEMSPEGEQLYNQIFTKLKHLLFKGNYYLYNVI